MTVRIAGCDLGKASASFVTGTVDGDGVVTMGEPEYIPHDGSPFHAFERWYHDNDIVGCAALAATGMYAVELQHPVLVVPEDSCQEAALVTVVGIAETMNLVSVGARGCGVLSRQRVQGGQLQVQYLENDKCSSGTGENIQKIANRFGLTLPEADDLACRALGSVAITARCSVFAKSEMTHYANQGKPSADLFAGYFASIARNTYALLTRSRVDGPVYLIGGCARIRAFKRALEKQVGDEVQVLEHALSFEAIGAATLAAERQAAMTFDALPSDPAHLIRERKRRFSVLEPASVHEDRVTMMPDPARAADWQEQPVVLGLDLGSTGAKAVLTSIDTGEIVLDVYDQTRGNPVDAARRLVHSILDMGTPDVRAIGLTGSGREAVATLFRAVFPEPDRILVLNEIVAHATGAIRCDPDGGRDLSVIEIGGQDAKYVRISGGRIVESDMNKACSAGTGSFLEEQARFYDVRDIGQFVELAQSAKGPPDLGQMCTVYVADAGAEALKDGFELADLFGGFQYSIIHNYLDRVMGQRTLAPKVFFQGKPASNPSLAWTLAAVTGRDIIVPPNPGAMGAWGIGLCAVEQLPESVLLASSLDLGAVLRAEITARAEFQCKDKDCQTLCPIERTTISVAGAEKTALSGGACPKFEVASQTLPKLAKDAPNPFDARAKLLDAFDRQVPGREVVAIPVTGPLASYLPWLATLAYELGFSVKALRSDKKSLGRGEQLCNSFDSCGPTKIAHAICDVDDPILLFPKILDVADPRGRGGQTCVTEQAMPEIVEQSLLSARKKVRVVRPVLSFQRGLEGHRVTAALLPLVGALGVTPIAIHRAVGKAAAAQRRFDERCVALGREALAYARREDLPSVVVCGPQHVIHDRAINATIPNLLRQNGAMAIPMDCYPTDPATVSMKKIYWGDANRYLRAAASARETRDVFPLMLSSFGCGPASFTEQVFQSLLEGYPHTILESDGHGGTAGFVTRIQAFLQSVRQFRAEDMDMPLRDNSKPLRFTGSTPRKGAYLDRDARYVFLSSVDYLGPVFAAVYRSYGYDALTAPPLSAENFACGRRDCSGKECLSYQFVWGAFREYLEANPPAPDKDTRLVQISGESCRAGVFGVKDRITLDKLGYGDNISVTSLRIAGGPGMSVRVWVGVTAIDIIRQLYLYHLAVGAEQAKALYHRYSDRVIELLETPTRRGWAVAGQLWQGWRSVIDLIEEASAEFAKLETRSGANGEFRRVFVSGDIMTKGNDFANGGLYEQLAARNVRVVAEPTGDFVEYLSRAQPHLLYGKGSSRAQRLIFQANMVSIRRKLYGLVRGRHPWIPVPDVGGAIQQSGAVLDKATNSGAVLALGNALQYWDQGDYDGIVMTACWGCDNGLITESLLRHRRDIPTFYFYDDATPIDERRLSSFAFRLHRGQNGRRSKVG